MPKRRRIKPFVKDLYWLPVRYVNKAAVRRYFKFTFGPEDDRETVLLFRVRRFPDGRDWIGLPKGQPDLVEKCLVGGFGMDRFRDLRCRAPADIPLKFNGKYRNYQVDAVLEMLEHENGVLESAPRTGKCVVGSTLIFTDKGCVPIRSLFKNNERLQHGSFGHVKTPAGYKEITGLYQKRVDSVVRLRTHLGYTVTGTPNHPVLVLTSDLSYRWKQLSELKSTDHVCIDRGLEWESSADAATKDEAELMGYLVANGGLGTADEYRYITFTSNNKRVQKRVKVLVNRVLGKNVDFAPGGARNVGMVTVTGVSAIRRLRSLGLKMVTAAHKEIPASVMRSSKEAMTAFLRAYFSCDAYLGAELELSSASAKLINQIAVVLAGYGVVGRRKVKESYARNSSDPTIRPYYHMYIAGDDRNRFLRTFRPRKPYDAGVGSNHQYLVDRLPHISDHLAEFKQRFHANSGMFDNGEHRTRIILPREMRKKGAGREYSRTVTRDSIKSFLSGSGDAARLFDGELVDKLASVSRKSRFIYDAIESVKTINRPTMVYDISVPDARCFVGNGIVCHNTIMAVALAIERQVKTLILAHQTDLIEQFCNETINDESGELFDGHEYLQSGEPIAGICTRLDEFERYPICLATYQSFITRKGRRLLSQIKDMFGMVVTDECHRGPAKEYSRVLTRFSAAYTPGMSATPKRRDNRYVMADRIIGPVVHKTKARALKPRVRLIDTGGRIGIKQDEIPENFTSLVNYMAGNDKRNAIIAKAAVHEAEKGHSILIPTLRIEHAEELARRINAEWGEEICFQFTGRIPKRDRQKARDRMNSDESVKVVMATRSMLLGMNIARWSCLISISLIANKPVYDQEVQRICTDIPGKKQPEVIYVLDSDIGWAWGCFRKSKQTLTDPEIISDMTPAFRRAAGGMMKK